MNIKDYIAVDEDGSSLYAVHFEDAEADALAELLLPDLGRWQDLSCLLSFFKENWNAFSAFYHWVNSPMQAVELTQKGANYFLERLLEYAERGKTERTETLSQLFQPLGASEGIKPFGESKYKELGKYTRNPAPWLRVYAIRLEQNLFVITGGGIKTTRSMQDCPRLSKELEKLEYCAQHLKERGDEDFESAIFELY